MPPPDFPDGVEQIEWNPLQIDGPANVLILPDIHIPYHHNPALRISVDSGRRDGADHVLINGDLLDFYQMSSFRRDPRMTHTKDELELGQKFFEWLRGSFPKARIIYKIGNHDERFEHYVMDNAPELVGLPEFEFASFMHLDKHGVELVKDKNVVRLGTLNVIHGHEYKFAISNPVNPARGLFLKALAYAMCSHFHQKSEHSENNIEGKSITTWSTGCLCGLRPAYMPLNKWSNGFARVEVFNDNKFNPLNHKISNGRIY